MAKIDALFAALDIERDNYRVLGLLPLVYVAWADGSIARAERVEIMRTARDRGWLVGGGEAILERWLAEPPDVDVGLALLAELLPRNRGVGAALQTEVDVLIASCRDVARAAGGRFGLRDPITDDEAAALEHIALSLGIQPGNWRDVAAAAVPPDLPPGPRGHALLGMTLRMVRDPAATLLSAFADYGDVFSMRAGGMRLVFIASPEGAQRVLVHNADNYVRGRVMAPLRKLSGDNMVTADGDVWRRLRRTAQPAFSGRFHEALLHDVVRLAAVAVAGWEEGVVDVDDEMSRVTLGMIGSLLCGGDFGEPMTNRAVRTIVAFTAPANLALSLPVVIPTPNNVRFNRAQRHLFALIDDLIAERRRAPREHHDLLAVLMRATDDPLDDAELRTEMLTFLMAGHETTAAALTWSLHLLATHPDVRSAVEREIAEVLADSMSIEGLARLTLTERVLLEAMRLYAPAPSIPRECLSEDRLGGYRIAPGSVVVVSPWLIHRHPGVWVHPERFDPDRFLPDRIDSLPPLAHLPFGAGPHKCIGLATSMMEMKVMLATILSRCRVDHPEGAAPIKPAIGVALRPTGGLPMRVTRR